MAFSVNTNVGAMAALQSLSSTQKDLSTTQSRINTGLAVSSTKDDSATYTIAQGLRSDLGGLKSVSSSLSRAKSVTDVAVAGAEQISDIVNQMKAKAYQAADAGQTTDSRTQLNNDFTALRDQIETIVATAEFNGKNLIASNAQDFKVLSTVDGSTITVGKRSGEDGHIKRPETFQYAEGLVPAGRRSRLTDQRRKQRRGRLVLPLVEQPRRGVAMPAI